MEKPRWVGSPSVTSWGRHLPSVSTSFKSYLNGLRHDTSFKSSSFLKSLSLWIQSQLVSTHHMTQKAILARKACAWITAALFCLYSFRSKTDCWILFPDSPQDTFGLTQFEQDFGEMSGTRMTSSAFKIVRVDSAYEKVHLICRCKLQHAWMTSFSLPFLSNSTS